MVPLLWNWVPLQFLYTPIPNSLFGLGGAVISISLTVLGLGVKLTRSFFLPKRTQTPAVYREEKEATSAPPAQTVPLDKEALKVIWTTGKEWTRALSVSELTHLTRGGHQGLILAPTSVCIDPEMTSIQQLTGHQGTIAILLLWPNSCRAQHQAQAEPRSWNTIYLEEVLSCFRLPKWRHKWTNG